MTGAALLGLVVAPALATAVAAALWPAGGTPSLGDRIGGPSPAGPPRRLPRARPRPTLEARLEAAGLRLSSRRALALAATTLATVGCVVALALGPVAGLVVATAAGAALWLVPGRLTLRRREQFRQVLPDGLALLAGTLAAGHALAPAIAMVARDCPEPVGSEWGRAVAMAQHGLDLVDALERVGERMHSAEMGWVVLVLRVQREVGGSLGGVLATVADSMRERERHRRRVRALTAEARLSAIILAALPMVFAGYLALVRPEYLRLLVTTPLGLALTAVALALLAVGVMWMRMLVRDPAGRGAS